jgi:hypothetical protein
MPSNFPGLMNGEELKQWILRRLGAPFIRVELDDAHLSDCVEFSKRWFCAKKGVKKILQVNVIAGQVDYQLPPEVDTVTDIAFPVPPMDISLIFSPFILVDDKVPYDVFAAPSAVGVYSSFTQTLQYVEMAKRVLGAEPNWRQEGQTLYLLPIPKVNSGALVYYKSNDFTIDQLGERDHDLVKRYALMKAKKDLAQIRGKYSGYPAAQGTVELDADKMMSQANDEEAKLEEEIFDSGFPLGLLWG